MKSHESFAHQFFNQEKEHLEKNYPGITLNRLKQELGEFSFFGYLNKNEFFKSPYIEGDKSGLKEFFKHLKKGVPLEYISGVSHFYRSKFSISSEVLIPRSETELLVEMGLKELKKLSKVHEKLSFVDLGTGSGNIFISILRDMGFSISAVAIDINPKALKIAKRNYFLNQFTIPKKSQVKFLQMDRLSGDLKNQHLIITNPPYIMGKNDRKKVHKQTLNFEPNQALFLEDNLYFPWFSELFKQALKSLVPGGIFLMEGHEDHLDALSKLGTESGFVNCSVVKDHGQSKRFLRAEKAK